MDYPHLHGEVKEIVKLSASERIAWMRNARWIGYPRAQEILDRLDDLLHYPKQARMPSMLLVGRTNNGKTKLIEKFLSKHPIDENPRGESIIAPVLYVEAPPSPGESGFYAEILNNLYERVPSSSPDAKRNRVLTVLQKIQVKVLVIDELHNILAGVSVRQQETLNMIKYLSNTLKISIVGCGTGDLLRAVSIDSQIQNRFKPEILPVWKMGTDFKRLLTSFECILPLKEPSILHASSIASKLLAMSEGSIGELSILLNEAAKYCIINNEEKITADALNNCGFVAPADRKTLAASI